MSEYAQLLSERTETPPQPEQGLPVAPPDQAPADPTSPLTPDPTAPENAPAVDMPELPPAETPSRTQREEIVVSPTHTETIVVDPDAGEDRPERNPSGRAKPGAPESALDFRKTPIKGRMPKLEVWVEGMWVPVGVWTFEHYPNLSGDDLRDVLISHGLPQADAAWFGIQRAVRLAKLKELEESKS